MLEVEEVHLLGSSDTLKMTVLDNDETFAMDEFYFSFFSRTREAFSKLQACLNEKSAEYTPEKRYTRPSSESTSFKDSVRDTTTLIRASSPTPESMQANPSIRRSSESVPHTDIIEDAELIESGQRSPKLLGLRGALKNLGLPSFTSRRSHSSSSLLQSVDTFDGIGHGKRSPGPATPQTEEPSWSAAGKMLWSRSVNAADWMRQRSAKVGTQVGTMLASPTSTINAGVGKVSQLWSGEASKSPYARWVNEETAKDMKEQNPEERFQTHFALPPTEGLLGSYYGYVFRTFPFYGKVYLSKRHFCFRSLLPGIKTKVSYRVGLINIDDPSD